MIAEELLAGAHEHPVHPAKALLYRLERRLGHLLFRRPPPPGPAPRLLNLGCGPLRYPGWINADEYAFKRALRQREFAPDWRLDVSRPWCCEDDHWDGIFTQHVLEHLHYSDVVRTLRECLRTLRPGAWLRISVPGLRQALRPASHPGADCATAARDALAVSFLAQMHGHLSVWNAELLCTVLQELRFSDVREVEHGQGTDPRLVMDQDGKRTESVYVEARKPS